MPLIVRDAAEMKPDSELIAVFQRRDGMRTEVTLANGQRLSVWNIAWGYDIGDEYAHVTTNCSPFVGKEPLDFFYTDEVTEVREVGTGGVLFIRNQ